MVAIVAVLAVAASVGAGYLRQAKPPPPATAKVQRLPVLKVITTRRADPVIFEKELAMSHQALLARWDREIAAASKRFGVPRDWIRAVMRQESGGRTVMEGGHPITSTAGAMGVMQVMPETYDEMRSEHRLGDDPYDPRDNILAGTAYLRFLHAKYGYPAMLAAYNAGPGNLELHLARKRDLPAETVAYLASVTAALSGQAIGLKQDPPPMVRLTRPDGQAVAVDPTLVKAARAVLPGEYPPSARTVITMGSGRQAIREDLSSATTALRMAGAHL